MVMNTIKIILILIEKVIENVLNVTELDNEKGITKEERMFSETEVWKLITKAITRTLYDAIATHEAHKQDVIEVEWLRDYADMIAVSFPRIQE